MGGPVKENKVIVTSHFIPLSRTCINIFGSCLAIWILGYYRFSPSWVAFGAIGYSVYKRALEKRHLISDVMKTISLDEKNSILNSIGVHELPNWVYFPDVERTEWLNKVIYRTWPYISEYVTRVLVDFVQPTVNKKLPSYLQPFVFLRTDLGDTPPRIGGVKVYTEESIHRDEIVMDIDLMLYSDARIKVSVGKIITGVKDFELRGTLRILIKPLVSKIPFAGAVTFCFLDCPYINFLLTHLGNILTFPGLQQTLHHTIQDSVSSLCVLPNRVSISLVDDIVVEQLKFPSAQGVIRIKIISARNLMAADINLLGKNSSDPYCIVRVGAEKFITSVKQKTLNPSWNECFEAVVDQRIGQSVIIEVWDEDKNTKDDELGTTSVSIEDVYLCGKLNSALVLQGAKVTGYVNVEMTWLDLSANLTDFAEIERSQQGPETLEKTNLTNYLFVRVEQAKHLQRVKFIQEPSPYCVLQINNRVQNTAVREKTQNPIWESTHHFLFSNPDIQSLNIEIRDSRSEVILGTLGIPLKHLKIEKDMTVTRPYSLQAGGPDNASLFLHLELRTLKPGPDRRPMAEQTPIAIDNPSQPPSPFAPSHEAPSVDHLGSKDRTPPSVVISAIEDTKKRPDNPAQLKNGGLKNEKVSDLNDDLGNSSVVDPPNPAGRLRLAIRYDVYMEILEVTVERAEKLLGVDKHGLSDPYAKLTVIDPSGHLITGFKKTKVVRRELSPYFNESFEFSVMSEMLDNCWLHVDIKNRFRLLHRNSRTCCIGSVDIPLSELKFGSGWTEWYWLRNPMG